MNKQKWIILSATLALMALGAGGISHFKTQQKLGLPGVRTHPIAGSIRLRVELPERVLNYESREIETDKTTLAALPPDTSFGQRYYRAADGSFEALISVVLMGSDRTSLHKPQFCLEGAGCRIDDSASLETTVHIDRPYPYELPIVKLIGTQERETANGQRGKVRRVYVYWYVADGTISAGVSGFQRMWWMSRELFRTGVLQRWAYVACLADCLPGQEDAAFERLKTLIAASVPEFQLTPPPAGATVTARQ